MTDLRTAAQQALEALVSENSLSAVAMQQRMDAITALRAALAEPQEPVAWLDEEINCAYTPEELDGGTADGLVPLYAAPPQRKPLSDEEIEAIWKAHVLPGFGDRQKFYSPIIYARAVEAAHGIEEGT